MGSVNNTGFDNSSYTFFGPMDMAFYDHGNALDEETWVKVVVSLVLVLSMILSLTGNVCTCAVVARERTMRTPTNCYLFNLAITDLLLAFFVPLEVYILWFPEYYPLGEDGCWIHFALWECLNNCSVLTIAAFTFERYILVSKPFLRQKLALKSRVYKIIVFNWAVSLMFSIPDLLFIDLLEAKKNAHVYCYFKLSEKMLYFYIAEIFVFFVMPMTMVFVLYVLIALKLNTIHLRLRSSPVYSLQNREKAVKMLAAVAGSFFFCWTPYFVLRVITVSQKFNIEEYFDMWRILNNITTINGYLSTAVNPILYSLMSRKFRQAFKDFLKGRKSSTKRIDTNILQLQVFNLDKS